MSTEQLQYKHVMVAKRMSAAVEGAPAVGRGLLKFGVNLTIPASADIKMVGNLCITPLTGYATDGHARLAITHPPADLYQPGQQERDRTATFVAELGFDQVRILDEHREPDGTRPLELAVVFLLDGPFGIDTAGASFSLRLGNEEWHKILKSMNYEERATFEVPVAGGQVGPPFDKAAEFLRDSLKQRDLLHSPQAVAAAREVFNALDATGVPLAPAPARAEWDDKGLREAWNIEQRISFIRKAVEHATHVGHHRQAGDPSARQARLLVAMTALLLRYYSGE